MKPQILQRDESNEFWFKEGCFILETANDDEDQISIARVRVLPQTTTSPHLLLDTTERYLIVSGSGVVEVGDKLVATVGEGDVVRIPPNVRQRITNTGTNDLIFYAICSPPFTPKCYVSLDDENQKILRE